MKYTVKALADLAGVTPRTLRWYDRQGLLKPGGTTEGGYRLYGPAQVARLQQILFYRELGLELSAIRAILDDPHFDPPAALQSHLAALEERRARLDELILTVQKTIDETKGGQKMSDQEKFEAFKRRKVKENEEQYGGEVRGRYGDAAMDASNARVLGLSEAECGRWRALDGELRRGLAAAVRAGERPEGPEGLRLAALHRQWLGFTLGKYEPEVHAGLARMYTGDERFTDYYDEEVTGCAAFLRDAILAYTKTL